MLEFAILLKAWIKFGLWLGLKERYFRCCAHWTKVVHFSPGSKYYGPKMGFVPNLVNRDLYCAVCFAFYWLQLVCIGVVLCWAEWLAWSCPPNILLCWNIYFHSSQRVYVTWHIHVLFSLVSSSSKGFKRKKSFHFPQLYCVGLFVKHLQSVKYFQ